MGKKDKKKGGNHPSLPQDPKPSLSSISKRGWKIIAAGAVFVIAGFIVLSMTDPRGQNWASQLCPFLIVGGYALMGAGLLVKDPVPTSSPAPLS